MKHIPCCIKIFADVLSSPNACFALALTLNFWHNDVLTNANYLNFTVFVIKSFVDFAHGAVTHEHFCAIFCLFRRFGDTKYFHWIWIECTGDLRNLIYLSNQHLGKSWYNNANAGISITNIRRSHYSRVLSWKSTYMKDQCEMVSKETS